MWPAMLDRDEEFGWEMVTIENVVTLGGKQFDCAAVVEVAWSMERDWVGNSEIGQWDMVCNTDGRIISLEISDPVYNRYDRPNALRVFGNAKIFEIEAEAEALVAGRALYG